ncbi:MAG TPA: prepilin-type N-terminal cleavage/methylation domain-containing protein [Phycisphaerae bacterium]|nr:prepilin-type N-terminal cleavage/methylation domain-containing protein [Phycisphaerae bacterium]
MTRKSHGFTLIELLVVVGIIALLMAILLPTLGRARERARTTRCLANLHSIGQGLVAYQGLNDGYVVPSFNMPQPGTFQAAAGDVVDGWAAILDRDGVVPGSQGPTNNVFFCPNTQIIDGMAGGQTAYDQNKPQGYQDWPVQFTQAGGDSATKQDPTLPIAGFGDSNGPYVHEIRCGYWLNATNPIGTAPTTQAPPLCTAYTQSVGFGPYGNGSVMPLVRSTNIARPQALIVATDGIYMGRQSVVRIGEQNRRIGYRHPGRTLTVSYNGSSITTEFTVTNSVFADGHAESINNNDFPHSNAPAENNGPCSILATQ